MSPATLKDVLRAAPDAWRTTEHGGRSEAAINDYLTWVARTYTLDGRDGGLSWHRNCAAAPYFTAPLLAAWLDSLRDAGAKPATRNRALSAIVTLWRRAHRRGLLPASPSGLYERESKGRRRVLSPEEEPRLLAALAEPYRPLAAFLLASGLRVSEALRLEWRDVQFAGRARELTVTVRDSKNGDPRAVPVVGFGGPKAVANGLPVADLGPYAGISQSAFNHAWAAARASMGLQNDPEFVPHALRHTYATRLVVAGVPLSVVARLLGHRSVKTTMRYSHVSDQDAAEWIRKVRAK